MKGKGWFEKEEAHWSNERTMLSHVRTGLTAIALGMGVLNFLQPTNMAVYVGTVFMIIGLFFLAIGPAYYVKRKKRINQY